MIDWWISFLVDNNGVQSWRHESYARPHPQSSDSLTNHLLAGPTRPLIQITAGTASCCCTKLTFLNPVRIGKIYLKVFELEMTKKKKSRVSRPSVLNVLKSSAAMLKKMWRKLNGWPNQVKRFIKWFEDIQWTEGYVVGSKISGLTSFLRWQK